MMRFHVRIRCILWSLVVVVSPALMGADRAKPNVLFLFADDMRADSIGALGNPAVKTPHLDQLVRRGFSLTNAYCLGGNSAAVCTPSRNMVLSGNAYFRWKDFTGPGSRNGLIAPADSPNFPAVMKQAGYLTYHHGKKGNTAPLIQAVFDVNKYLANDEAERRTGEPGREIVDAAIEFLEQKKQLGENRPFFMYLAFANPHDPRVAAEKYLDLYDRDAIPLPANYLPVHPFDNGEMTVRDERLSPWPRTPDEIRRTLHEYYATITAMDHHIGRLIETLDKTGQLDNTLIVFSADQGIAVGSHGLLGKQSLYDAAMKSPLVFAGPGVPHGESPALVYLFDIFPTVCQLVGVAPPSEIDGVSFKNVLQGRIATFREIVFLSYRNVQRAVRDERWKLIRYPQVDVTQLFDLKNDPCEQTNVADDPAHRERIQHMMAQLRDRQMHYGDDQPLSVADAKPASWTPPVDEEKPAAKKDPGKKARSARP